MAAVEKDAKTVLTGGSLPAHCRVSGEQAKARFQIGVIGFRLYLPELLGAIEIYFDKILGGFPPNLKAWHSAGL